MDYIMVDGVRHEVEYSDDDHPTWPERAEHIMQEARQADIERAKRIAEICNK